MTDLYANARSQAIALLHSRVENFLRFRNSIRDRVVIECVKNNKLYKGKRSWPKDLQKWSKTKQTELVTYMKAMGLCRKHVKLAVMHFRVKNGNDTKN